MTLTKEDRLQFNSLLDLISIVKKARLGTSLHFGYLEHIKYGVTAVKLSDNIVSIQVHSSKHYEAKEPVSYLYKLITNDKELRNEINRIKQRVDEKFKKDPWQFGEDK